MTFISPSLIRHVILRMGTNANVSRLLSKFMWHGDLNSCLTESPMRMRSVSEYKWSDTMEKQDIIGSIAENGGLCPKTKPTSDNYSVIKG